MQLNLLLLLLLLEMRKFQVSTCIAQKCHSGFFPARNRRNGEYDESQSEFRVNKDESFEDALAVALKNYIINYIINSLTDFK